VCAFLLKTALKSLPRLRSSVSELGIQLGLDDRGSYVNISKRIGRVLTFSTNEPTDVVSRLGGSLLAAVLGGEEPSELVMLVVIQGLV
jgi:hypothetical protein